MVSHCPQICSVYSQIQFSHSVMSDSLRPHGLQHAGLPCPSPTPGACSNSCPSSQWYHPTISVLCHPLLLLSIFPHIRIFSNESVLHIRWPKYWSFSFSISPSNEYSKHSINSCWRHTWVKEIVVLVPEAKSLSLISMQLFLKVICRLHNVKGTRNVRNWAFVAGSHLGCQI